ncbi:hypothetical protein SESBI_31609 [Sesbania bispinosa]|nr:hypothetical protein SESBI_31609 [Sesbania bispinosa]
MNQCSHTGTSGEDATELQCKLTKLQCGKTQRQRCALTDPAPPHQQAEKT